MVRYAPRSQCRAVLDQKAEMARELLARGLRVNQITAQLGVSPHFVRRIRDGQRLSESTSPLSRSLHHGSFALLWRGQLISLPGDSVYLIALAWWVLRATHSAAAMGALLIFSTVPAILLLVGGIASDPLPRLWLMVGSDLAAALAGSVAPLAALHLLAVWHLFMVGAPVGLAGAFFSPAYSAALIGLDLLHPSVRSLD